MFVFVCFLARISIPPLQLLASAAASFCQRLSAFPCFASICFCPLLSPPLCVPLKILALPRHPHPIGKETLVDVSDFIFFSARGRGKGSPRSREGGRTIFYWNSQEGGSPSRVEGVCGKFGGGGLNIFFSGPKLPPRNGSQITTIREGPLHRATSGIVGCLDYSILFFSCLAYVRCQHQGWKIDQVQFSRREASLLKVGAFLLIVDPLCLQSIQVLIRGTFQL